MQSLDSNLTIDKNRMQDTPCWINETIEQQKQARNSFAQYLREAAQIPAQH